MHTLSYLLISIHICAKELKLLKHREYFFEWEVEVGVLKGYRRRLWVGPSKCDEMRSAKEKDIEEVWNDLISAREFRGSHPLLIPAINLFREVLSCYQNEAYIAMVLMCRASTETTVYLLVSREIEMSKELKLAQEVRIDRDLIQAK
ncbi:MAG: hypothetical protein JTT16_04920 [Candidatus Brockarchaeota archaeon]|nr:hypothetical protein [Candidatus Brockarchaeota archaeon]